MGNDIFHLCIQFDVHLYFSMYTQGSWVFLFNGSIKLKLMMTSNLLYLMPQSYCTMRKWTMVNSLKLKLDYCANYTVWYHCIKNGYMKYQAIRNLLKLQEKFLAKHNLCTKNFSLSLCKSISLNMRFNMC